MSRNMTNRFSQSSKAIQGFEDYLFQKQGSHVTYW